MRQDEIRFRQVIANGIRLHLAEAGPDDGPLVLLLHGFPEFWYGWRNQLPALAAAGYRVVAPDQRGYNLSEKPPGIAAYRLDLLVGDIVGLMDALGRERATVGGHDWGAAVAWEMALRNPERVERLAILNVPHPVVFQRNLRRNPRQMRKSWYFLFFQLPWLPEALARRGNWEGVAAVLRSSSRPGTFTEEDITRYRAAWSQPCAYTAMVNWYRAVIQHRPPLPAHRRVAVPTEIIWGVQDRFLEADMAQESLEFCDRGHLTLVPQATHWVQHEESEIVNERLLSLLSQG
jgi:pimeloyl-ACP methyl ester carboxylesterase